MNTTDNLCAWRLLKALGDCGGLKQASMEVQVDFARATRLIQQLEDALGVPLISHRERPAKLTPEGRELLPAVTELLESHIKLEKAAKGLARREVLFRLSIPINSPRNTIYKLIRECSLPYPEIKVQLLADCDHEDIIHGKTEAAYLPYRPPKDGLIIFTINRSLASVPLAAPEYVLKRGLPIGPEEMRNHDIIVRSGRHYPLTKSLCRRGEEKPLLSRNIAFAGDVLSAKEALLAGEGIAIDLSLAACERELQQGLLVPVLGGWHKKPWDVTIAVSRDFLHNQRVLSLVRDFAEKEAAASKVRARKIKEILDKHEEEVSGKNVIRG